VGWPRSGFWSVHARSDGRYCSSFTIAWWRFICSFSIPEWYREGYFGQQETEVVVLVRKAGDDEFVPITMVNFE